MVKDARAPRARTRRRTRNDNNHTTVQGRGFIMDRRWKAFIPSEYAYVYEAEIGMPDRTT